MPKRPDDSPQLDLKRLLRTLKGQGELRLLAAGAERLRAGRELLAASAGALAPAAVDDEAMPAPVVERGG